MPADESGCQSWAAHEPSSNEDSKQACLCVTTTDVSQPDATVKSVRAQQDLFICYATAIIGSQYCHALLYRGESSRNERRGSRAQATTSSCMHNLFS